MKIKLSSLYSSVGVINKILSQDVPIVTAFRIREAANKAHEPLAALEESRLALAKKFAGDADRVPDDLVGEFNEEFAQLLDEEVELDVTQISVHDLPNVEISGNDTTAINWLILNDAPVH